jgi:hypothetical protein
MSGRSSCTTAPICGTPAESQTIPLIAGGPAQTAEELPRPISTANNARWSLRIITNVGDPAASLAKSVQTVPPGFPDLMPGNLDARDDAYYSTTKGADCAISCFEIVSFILIVTLYLPGCRPAMGSDFSTVN